MRVSAVGTIVMLMAVKAFTSSTPKDKFYTISLNSYQTDLLVDSLCFEDSTVLFRDPSKGTRHSLSLNDVESIIYMPIREGLIWGLASIWGYALTSTAVFYYTGMTATNMNGIIFQGILTVPTGFILSLVGLNVHSETLLGERFFKTIDQTSRYPCEKFSSIPSLQSRGKTIHTIDSLNHADSVGLAEAPKYRIWSGVGAGPHGHLELPHLRFSLLVHQGRWSELSLGLEGSMYRTKKEKMELDYPSFLVGIGTGSFLFLPKVPEIRWYSRLGFVFLKSPETKLEGGLFVSSTGIDYNLIENSFVSLEFFILEDIGVRLFYSREF